MNNEQKLIEWLKDCPVPYHLDSTEENHNVVYFGFDCTEEAINKGEE